MATTAVGRQPMVLALALGWLASCAAGTLVAPRRLQEDINITADDSLDNTTAGASLEDMAESALAAAEEAAVRARELIQSVRSEKCDAMHSLTCIQLQQSCLKWNPEGGEDGLGNCTTLPSEERPGAEQVQCYYGDSDDGLSGMPFLLAALSIGCAVTTLLTKISSHKIAGRKLGLPFTVVMFAFGFAIESLFQTEFIEQNFVRMELSVSGWVNSHPHIILFVLLPPLLFEDSASIDYHVFRKSLPSSLLLAGPGVMISSGLSGMFSWLLFNVIAGNDYTLATHMLLGGILSATDPVAVLGVLKSLGAPAKLNLIIGGESLLNDGTAVVVFWIFRDLVAECSDTDFMTVFSRFVVLAIGGVSWGWIAAHIMYLWIKVVTDPIIEVSIVITCVFAVFWIAEEVLGVSGILACVVFGLGTARKSYFCMSAECLERNHMIWEQLGFVTTMVIFMLTGIVARGKLDAMFNRQDDKSDILGGEGLSTGELELLGYLTVVYYVAVFVVRGLTIAMLFPILQTIGYGVTKKEAMFMTFGGLRGAVSLALALLIDSHPTIDNKTKDFVLIQTAGVVTLSLLINGTTSGYVYEHLKLYRKNRYHDQLVQQAMGCMHDDTITWMYSTLAGDEFHCEADLGVIKDLMIDFSKAELLDDELVGYEATPVSKAQWPADITSKRGDTAAAARNGQKSNQASEDGDEDGFEQMLGSSDPYVEVVMDRGGRPSKRKSTSVKKKTLDPVWTSSNKFKFTVYGPETTMYATVYDWDFGPKDDYLGEAKLDLKDLIDGTAYPETKEVQEEIKLRPPTRNFTVEESILSSFEGGAAGRSSPSTKVTTNPLSSAPLNGRRSPGRSSPTTPGSDSLIGATVQGVGDALIGVEQVGEDLAHGVLDATGFVVGGIAKGVAGMYKATEAAGRMTAIAATNFGITARQAALIRGSLSVTVRYVPKNPAVTPSTKILDSPLLGKQLGQVVDGVTNTLVQTQTSVGHVEVEVIRGNNLAASDPANMSTANQKLVNDNHDATDMLSDANRMVRIETGQGQSGYSEFDARNALYGVFLQHLLAMFRQASEADSIGDAAANALEHAIGVANDVAIEAHESGTLQKGALLVMWDEVKAYIRTGNSGVLGTRVPHLWFAHMQTCAEMLFVVNKGFEAVSSRPWGTLTDDEVAADDQVRI
jgi:NhaP-type Na+/H+ or K+/H+ antiporter